MSLEHYRHAKTHLDELEDALLNVPFAERTPMQLELAKLHLAAGRLALDLGIQNTLPATPEPAPKTVPKNSSKATVTTSNTLNSGFAMYDHVNIKDEHLFSEGKRKLLFVIGKKFYQLEGAALESRLLEAASKIVQKSVAHLDRLNFKDGNKILEDIKAAAIANGSFVEGAR